MKKIYLDYAATSPVKHEVLKAMKPYFSKNFGNPSSLHSFGREARVAVDKARAQIARFLNCLPEEIIFTSGGTESDNLAIRGVIKTFKHLNIKTKPHIITSAFEHHAVLHTCKDLEKQGLVEVTYIKPDKEGIIHLEDIEKAIKLNTVLVSIMYVNNEIGTVQPIQKIGKLVDSCRNELGNKKLEISQTRFQNQRLYPVYFHTDAVQAIEYQDCDVKKLGVDMLSLSAHKFGGPKGIGILYVKKGTPIKALQTGGAQEYNLRAGTENVPAIVGLGKAIKLINSKSQALNSKQIQNSNVQNPKNLKLIKLRDYFINEITKKIPDVRLNGSRTLRNPNNVNISFKYVEGESILIYLDLAGIAASTGSACTSGSLEPSHVLLSMGLSHEDVHGAIRFTLGDSTSKNDIDYVVKNLVKIIKKLRKMSPFAK